MCPFEVPEGPYQIEKVMEAIRVQVIEPAPSAAPGPPAEGGNGAAAGGGGEPTRPIISDGGPVSRLAAHLELLRQRQNLEPAYRIRSHRPILGPLLDLLKRVIHWGSRPYTDAIRVRQEAYNESVLQALREITLQFERNIQRIDDHKAYIESFHKAIHELQHADAGLAQRANDLVRGIEELAGRMGEQSESLRARAVEIHELAGRAQSLAGALEVAAGRVDRLYERYDISPLGGMAGDRRRLDALEHSRGTYEDIRCRQYQYLEIFEGAPGQVLDAGCGRGEFLRMLRIHGVECWGVDTDPLMVEFCRQAGEHVRRQDALEALEGLAEGSLGGIFAAQVIEHFFPGDVVRFIALARRKIAPGGRIVLETLNPAALGVHAKSYWHDLEHKQMLHPNYLKGMLELAGFEAVEVRPLSPFGDDERLAALPPAAALGLSEAARQALQKPLDRLNDLLYGAQDYVAIGRRGEGIPPEGGTPELKHHLKAELPNLITPEGRDRER